MKKVLIISPHFAPFNMPDMHRIRIMLPYLEQYNWHPIVITADPKYVDAPRDPFIERSVPKDTKVYHIKPLKKSTGIGNLGIRMLPALLSKGAQIIKKEKPNLIFFSTTMFPAVYSAVRWHKKFKIPFVIDFQDPWRNDYYLNLPKEKRPPKYKYFHLLNSYLEARTVPLANGFISVNFNYVQTIFDRYKISAKYLIEPMGTSKLDFEIAREIDFEYKFELDKKFINLVYTGVITDNMKPILKSLIEAISKFNAQNKKQIKLYFIGTDYAPPGKEKHKLNDITKKLNAQQYVYEQPERIPYFAALKLMLNADILLLPGTYDKAYSPSKIYPYLLSRKTFLTIIHRDSPANSILKKATDYPVINFSDQKRIVTLQDEILKALETLTSKKDFVRNEHYINSFTAEKMTERIALFFDEIAKK